MRGYLFKGQSTVPGTVSSHPSADETGTSIIQVSRRFPMSSKQIRFGLCYSYIVIFGFEPNRVWILRYLIMMFRGLITLNIALTRIGPAMAKKAKSLISCASINGMVGSNETMATSNGIPAMTAGVMIVLRS